MAPRQSCPPLLSQAHASTDGDVDESRMVDEITAGSRSERPKIDARFPRLGPRTFIRPQLTSNVVPAVSPYCQSIRRYNAVKRTTHAQAKARAMPLSRRSPAAACAQ